MRQRQGQQRGFTLVETSIILMVLVILASIMLPQMGGFNRLARFVRAKEDLGALCSVIKRMLDDVGDGALFGDPGPPHPAGHRTLPVGLLVGSGDTPLVGNHGDDRDRWTLPFGETFEMPTDGGNLHPEFVVDTMYHHLIVNTPLGDGHNHWRGPLDVDRGFNALFYWRGPYLDEIAPDPWGNRYMANVFALYNPPMAGPHDRYASAVVCYSAGPDAGVDTEFNQPFGWVTGDDDLAVVLNAGGPF